MAAEDAGLAISTVYRQLDAGGRFGRFEVFDAIPILLAYSITYLGSYVFRYAPLYAFVALLSGAVATYLLRTRFDLGPMALIRFILYPKHFSALAPDTESLPYPGRKPAAGAGEGTLSRDPR
jgi:hypothetical protein